jgi:hypothetical protein
VNRHREALPKYMPKELLSRLPQEEDKKGKVEEEYE